MKNEKIKVAVYIRVGNKNQVDETKNLQKNIIEEYLEKKRNYTITGYYIDDGYSGLNLKRPMLEKMLLQIEKGNIKEILVSDYSRISRNILELDNFVSNCLLPRNVKLTSVRNNNDFYNMQKKIKNDFLKKIACVKGKQYNGR